MTTGTKQKLLSIVGVALIVVLVLGGSIVYDNLSGGPEARQASIDANQVLEGQEQATAVSNCKSDYATADRVSSSNLDVTKAEVIDLFARLVLSGGEASPRLLTQFYRAERRLSASVDERASVAAIQDEVNRDCVDGRSRVPTVRSVVPLDAP